MKKFFKVKYKIIVTIICILSIMITACSNKNVATQNDELLNISFIDVGQADSILIQYKDKNMLIDTGNNGDWEVIESYLKENNVSKIDKLILTHPHEDHIGSAAKIINIFSIGDLYMPKATANTKTFENTVNAAKSKNLQAIAPKVGEKIKMEELEFTVLAPNNSKYDSLNNYSIVLKLSYGNNKFLFTGDAETLSENEILSKNYDVSADVIKIGHHGSNTSSSEKFIEKVNPKYAIISVGKNNDYHHPHKKVMDLLKNKNIKIFRTDENKTIKLTSDGKTIKFFNEFGSYNGN
ncbi:MAG: DNA internalization-related competence protein ComEC/Rec2 [Clostridiaceae bacterium]